MINLIHLLKTYGINIKIKRKESDDIMKLFEMIIIFKPKTSDEIEQHIMTEYVPLFKEVTDYIYFQDIGKKKLAYPYRDYKVG